MTVRIDKWLQVARVFKTRSQATRACQLSRVRCNGDVCKPHRALQLEDRVEIDKGEWTRVLIVKELRDKTLPKREAPRIYEDLTPPRPEREDWERGLDSRPARREAGAGRPTKRQRRQLDRWRDR